MAPQSAVALHGLGVPPERLSALAASAGLPLWRPGTDVVAARSRVVLLLGRGWMELKRSVFALPYSAWIETAEQADQAIFDLIQRAVGNDLFASVTTATANGTDLAGDLLAGIAAHRHLPEGCRNNIELALHEALCNALVHGNLQMDGIGELNFDALERFSSNLMQRMSDPDFCNRRIDVVCDFDAESVTVDVIDQGPGFTPKPKSEPKASGRGFELIGASCQSFQLLEGGRRVSMRFAL